MDIVTVLVLIVLFLGFVFLFVVAFLYILNKTLFEDEELLTYKISERRFCGYCNKEVTGLGEDGRAFQCPHCGNTVVNI